MRDLDHGDLFNPPKGTVAIVVPCAADVDRRGEATLKYGYARQAKQRWPGLTWTVGTAFKHVGARPMPLTYAAADGAVHLMGGIDGNSAVLPYHLICFPVRRHEETPVETELIANAARSLSKLCDECVPLREGLIVIPELSDQAWKHTKPPRDALPWAKLRPFVAPYLDSDRFVAIRGNRGTRV